MIAIICVFIICVTAVVLYTLKLILPNVNEQNLLPIEVKLDSVTNILAKEYDLDNVSAKKPLSKKEKRQRENIKDAKEYLKAEKDQNGDSLMVNYYRDEAENCRKQAMKLVDKQVNLDDLID